MDAHACRKEDAQPDALLDAGHAHDNSNSDATPPAIRLRHTFAPTTRHNDTLALYGTASSAPAITA